MPRKPFTDEELDDLLFRASPYASNEPTRSNLSLDVEVVHIMTGDAPPARHRRVGRLRWVAPAFAVALVGLVALVSIQPFLRGTQTNPASPASVRHTQEAPPEGLAATGELTSPDGSTTGTVYVHVDGEQARVAFADLRSTHADVRVLASLTSRNDDPCSDSGVLEWANDFNVSNPGILTLGEHYLHGDWTAINEINLVIDNGELDSCDNTIVARAPLEWTMSPLRPWLAELADGGERDGASNGTVIYAADGRPIQYVVGNGDRLEEVAARFGITSDDIFYMNEGRLPVPQDPNLNFGETLNLDLAAR